MASNSTQKWYLGLYIDVAPTVRRQSLYAHKWQHLNKSPTYLPRSIALSFPATGLSCGPHLPQFMRRVRKTLHLCSWSMRATGTVAVLCLIAVLMTWSMQETLRMHLRHHLPKLSSFLLRASVVIQVLQLQRSTGNMYNTALDDDNHDETGICWCLLISLVSIECHVAPLHLLRESCIYWSQQKL